MSVQTGTCLAHYCCLQSLVGFVIVALLLTGCSARTHFTIAKRPVKVSIQRLAEATPEWNAVKYLDQIQRQTLQSLPPVEAAIGQSAQPNVSSVSLSTNLKTINPDLTAIRNDSKRALAQIEARLDRNHARQMDLARVQATLGAETAIRDARRRANAEYLASLPDIMAAGAAHRTNLKVQIDALGVNADPLNAVTAPDDHWGHLRAARQAELDAATSPIEDAKLAAKARMNATVDATSERVYREADAELAAYQQSLDNRKRTIIQRQQAALEREQSELIQSAEEINKRLSETDTTVSERANSMVHTDQLVSSSMREQQIVSLDEIKHQFEMQRETLISQILMQTKLRAQTAADNLGLKVVNWNPKASDIKAQNAILAEMRSVDRAV